MSVATPRVIVLFPEVSRLFVEVVLMYVGCEFFYHYMLVFQFAKNLKYKKKVHEINYFLLNTFDIRDEFI